MIEPSGVGKLSDIVKVCEKVRDRDGVELEVTQRIAVVDGSSYEEYADGFGAFYLDQIRQAQIIFCSQMEELSEELGVGKEELVQAMEAGGEVESIYRPIHQKEGSEIRLLDKIEEKENLVELEEELAANLVKSRFLLAVQKKEENSPENKNVQVPYIKNFLM